MFIRAHKHAIQILIYSTGVGLASFILVLMINVVGIWLGFKYDENVPVEEIGYLNVVLFLISVALLAASSYGLVFYLIFKLFKFNRS